MRNTTLKRIKALIASSAIVLMLISCTNMFQDNSSNEADSNVNVEQNKTVVIRLGLKDEMVRAAYPTSVTFKSFSLTGTSEEEGVPEVTWQTDESAGDAKAQLSSAEVTVLSGKTYTFTLTATTESGAIYKDSTVPIQIVDSGTKLSFALTLVDVGSADAVGNASIAVVLPKNGSVNCVTVSVYSVNEDGTLAAAPISAAYTDRDVPASDGKAVFDSGELTAGVYCAVFTLWSENEIKTSRVALATWREYFVIAGNSTTTSTLNPNGDDLKPDTIYTITFHTDGGSIPAIYEFSRNTNIQASVLRSTRKDGNSTNEWYFDPEFTKPFTSTSGIKENIDLYAKWPVIEQTDAIVTIEEEKPYSEDSEKYSMIYYSEGENESEKYVFTVQSTIPKPTIRWYIDGNLQPDVTGRVFELPAALLSAGVHKIEAKTSYNGLDYSSSAELDILAEGEFLIDFDLIFEEGGLRQDAQ